MRKTLAMCLTICLATMPVIAKGKVDIVPPGNWAAVESLQKGTSISVRMTSADRVEGNFLDLDNESIRLTIDNQEKIYPRNSIAEIYQLRVPDRKLNGTLIGMGAGALAGVVGAVASDAPFSGEDTWGFLFVAVGIGLGAKVDIVR